MSIFEVSLAEFFLSAFLRKVLIFDLLVEETSVTILFLDTFYFVCCFVGVLESVRILWLAVLLEITSITTSSSSSAASTSAPFKESIIASFSGLVIVALFKLSISVPSSSTTSASTLAAVEVFENFIAILLGVASSSAIIAAISTSASSLRWCFFVKS